MYTLSFWALWLMVALLAWLFVFFAALGVNEVAIFLAEQVA